MGARRPGEPLRGFVRRLTPLIHLGGQFTGDAQVSGAAEVTNSPPGQGSADTHGSAAGQGQISAAATRRPSPILAAPLRLISPADHGGVRAEADRIEREAGLDEAARNDEPQA